MQPNSPHLLHPPVLPPPRPVTHSLPPNYKERERSQTVTPIGLVPTPTSASSQVILLPKDAVDHRLIPNQIHFNYQHQMQQQQMQRPLSTLPPHTQSIISRPVPQQKRVVVSAEGTTRPDVAIWQERYYAVYSRFEFFCVQIQQIQHHYTIITHKIQQARTPEELEALKIQAHNLRVELQNTEREMVETVQMNKDITASGSNWQEKYLQLEQHLKELSHHNQQLEEQKAQMLKHSEQLNQLYEQLTHEHQSLTVKYSEVTQLSQQNSSLPQESAVSAQQVADLEEQRGLLEQQVMMLQQELNTKSRVEEQYQLRLAHLQTDIMQLEQKNSELQQELANTSRNNNSSVVQMKTSEVVPPTEIDEKQKREVEELVAEVQLLQQVVGQYKAKEELQPVIFENQLKQHQAQILELQLLVQNKTKIIQQQEVALGQQQQPTSPTNLHPEKDSEIRRLTHEIQLKQDTHATDIKIYKSRIDELLQRNKSLTNEKEVMVARYIEQVNMLESDIAKRDAALRAAREELYQLENSQRSEKVKAPTPRENHSLKRQLVERTEELEEMRSQVSEYRRLNNQKEDTLNTKKHEINSLKRQVKELTPLKQEVDKLNNIVTAKNKEVVEMKSQIFEGQKLSHDLQMLQQQNNNLKETVKKRYREVNEANDRVYELEQQVKLNEIKLKQSNEKEEIQLLEQANKRKDQEILKNRQSIQLLETTARETEEQLVQTKNQLKQSNRQVDSLQSDLNDSQRKLIDLERKCADVEQIRQALYTQVSELAHEVDSRAEQMQILQNQSKMAANRIKNLESDNTKINRRLEEEIVRSDQWEAKCRQLQDEVEFEREKKRDLTQSKKAQIGTLTNKCAELEAECRRKDHRIKELEQTAENLGFRVRSFDHNLEEIQYLKEKTEEYERKLGAVNYFQYQKKYSDIEATQVFQNKLIYHLQKQNDELRSRQGLQLIKNGHGSVAKQSVRQRLNDFNSKLENLIENKLNPQQLDIDVISRYEAERQQLVEVHRQQIERLKSQMMDLGVWQTGGSNASSSSTNKMFIKIEGIYRERIAFYKDSNRELEDRVDNLLRVNRELKEQVEKLMRAHDGQYSIAFYKQEVSSLKDTNASLQKQLKKLTDELRRMREEEASTVRPLPESISMEMEMRINELNYKLNQLTLQNGMLEKDKTVVQQQLQSREAQVRKLKGIIEELKISKEELQRRHRGQDSEWQQKIAVLNNRVAFSQSQIQRLEEVLKTRNQTEGAEVASLRARISQMTEQQRKLKQTNQNLLLSAQQTKREMGKLQAQLRSAQDQANRAKDTVNNLNQRLREKDGEIQGLRSEKKDLERELRTKEGQLEQYGLHNNQLQQQIARLNGQVRLLQSEVERVNEVTRGKLSQKDAEIGNLKSLLNEKTGQLEGLGEKDNEIRMLQLKLSELHGEVGVIVDEANRLRAIVEQQRQAHEELLREKSNAVMEMEQRLRIAVSAKDQEMREMRSQWSENEQKASSAASSQAAELMRMQQRVMQCEAELLRAEAERKEWHEYREQIEEAFNEAANESSAKDSHIRHQELNLSEMARNLEASQEEIRRLKQLVETQKGNIENMFNEKNEQMSQADQRNKGLLQARDQQIDELKALLQQAQQRLIEANKNSSGEQRQLQQRLNSLESELLRMEAERKDWASFRQQIQEEYASLQGQNQQKDRTIRQLQSKIRQLEEQLRNANFAFEGDIGQLHQKISEYEGQLIRAEGERRQFLTFKEQIQRAYAELQSANQQRQSYIEELQQRLQASSAEKEGELGRLKQEYEQCYGNLAKAEDEIRALLEWKEQMEEGYAGLLAESQQKDSVIREIDDKARELSQYAQKLQQELNQARNALQEQDSLRGTMDHEKGQMSGEIDRLCEIIKTKEGEIRELYGRLQQLENQSASVASSQEGELIRLRQMLEQCEIELNKTRQDCAELNQAMRELDAACVNLSNQNRGLTENYSMLMDKFNHFTQLNEEKTHQIQRLNAILQQLDAKLNQQHVQREKLTRETQFSVELFRSIMIELDVLMQEEMVLRSDLVQRFQVEIGRGFQQCERWQVATQ